MARETIKSLKSLLSQKETALVSRMMEVENLRRQLEEVTEKRNHFSSENLKLHEECLGLMFKIKGLQEFLNCVQNTKKEVIPQQGQTTWPYKEVDTAEALLEYFRVSCLLEAESLDVFEVKHPSKKIVRLIRIKPEIYREDTEGAGGIMKNIRDTIRLRPGWYADFWQGKALLPLSGLLIWRTK